jgi:K+-transporting ATPase KdpF subunit
MNIVVLTAGVLALGLFAYLFFALLQPEKFE